VDKKGNEILKRDKKIHGLEVLDINPD